MVRKIVAIQRREVKGSFYDLYATGKYRDGRDRKPICGNGTVRKVRKFLVEGKLNPYLTYLDSESCPETAPTLQLLVPNSFPSLPEGPLPPVLLTEAERLLEVAQSFPSFPSSPFRQMEPADGISKKVHRALREHPGMGALESLLDSYCVLLAECERVRGAIAQRLLVERKKYSKKLKPAIEIPPWDEHLLYSFAERIGAAISGMVLPERRTYDPLPDQLQERLFIPSWDGLNLTLVPITDQQYEVVHQLHVDFRKFAEQFLDELIRAAVPPKVTISQLKEELENIIAHQQLVGI